MRMTIRIPYLAKSVLPAVLATAIALPAVAAPAGSQASTPPPSNTSAATQTSSPVTTYPSGTVTSAENSSATGSGQGTGDLDQELWALQQERRRIETRMALDTARRSQDLAQMRAEVERLKAQTELLAARRERQNQALRNETAELEARNARLEEERKELASQLAIANTRHSLELQRTNQRMELADANRRLQNRVDAPITYRENPMVDGVLEITDRRIPLNGPITMETADRITERIQFFNNKDARYPIFIVIDHSPGGSVMAGYRILKAIESSKAPVHVLVKSFAASMAAVITTLAPHSYAYPNAIILHHQLSSGTRGNLTQQREHVRESEDWSHRLLGPVCRKIGMNEEQFIKAMYEHDSDGDWAEFADKAVQLKWVNQVVSGVRELGVTELSNTNASNNKPATQSQTNEEEKTDADGERFVNLPRLQPFDRWFLYNPDRYYR